MSVLAAFYSTWADARGTFGQGVPDDGSRFDRSADLRHLKTRVDGAAPGARWRGSAALAYGDANREHARVFERLAGLDQKLSGEVRNAANLVVAGRQNLDSVRSWVSAMAATIPDDESGRMMTALLANRGLTRVAEVVQKTNGDMAEVGRRILALKGDYEANQMQRFAGLPRDVKTDRVDAPTLIPKDPKEFRRFWVQLTPAQRDKLWEQDHKIGSHPGMPFGDDTIRGRDHYNRRYLAELRQLKQAEANRLQAQYNKLAEKIYLGDKSERTGRELAATGAALREARHQLDGYNNVQATLDKSDGVPRHLAMLDDRGHAAVSLGNPDNASRNAIFVPGTGQDMTRFEASDAKSLAMYNAALAADPSLASGDVAVTTWMGYDRPMNLLEAAFPDRAHNGGSALTTFLDGLHASHNGPPAIDTVIGHSYGSTLVGGAATGDNQLAADNVIAVGSPGMLTERAGELNLEPDAQVYAMTAANDIIGLAADLTLGADPWAGEYGATRLATDPGPPAKGVFPSVEAHSSYWDPGNPGLANMGAVIAGVPPEQIAD
ncbi:alpha/beta hydrolase [Mycolicibacterium phlei]